MIGMLWFDNDPSASLEIKVRRASNYYHHKYGKIPTLCFVHPAMFPYAGDSKEQPKPLVIAGIELRQNRSVLPNHFWLGVEQPALEPA
jgi:hypothetical protein